eukprot:COSAG02_NODE_4375_length_5437_cov_7.337580_9_plen_70_part_00
MTLPVTRAEGFYYTQMYRFVSSDRVGLHGLMGAFGPTGNYNFWYVVVHLNHFSFVTKLCWSFCLPGLQG